MNKMNPVEELPRIGTGGRKPSQKTLDALTMMQKAPGQWFEITGTGINRHTIVRYEGVKVAVRGEREFARWNGGAE